MILNWHLNLISILLKLHDIKVPIDVLVGLSMQTYLDFGKLIIELFFISYFLCTTAPILVEASFHVPVCLLWYPVIICNFILPLRQLPLPRWLLINVFG